MLDNDYRMGDKAPQSKNRLCVRSNVLAMLEAVIPGDRILATMNPYLEMPRVRARTSASHSGVLASLSEIVGKEHLLVDPERVEPYGQDAVKEKFPC
ncbi:MAG: hypothetical protein H0W28_00465 [Pyrinomonadaceae bacterium]|nr:hypothetical protein [Pyrinomonadaceae bacterium]